MRIYYTFGKDRENMRISLLFVVLLGSTSISLAQSFAAFQRLENCEHWHCVVDLARENLELRLDRNIPWRLPLRRGGAQITSGFGYRTHPIDGGRRFHGGVDIAAPVGTEVLASGCGRASQGYSSVLGHYVRIDHLNGFVSTYGHLAEVFITDGELISQSSVIGSVGCSGRTTGPHLHWTIRYRRTGTVVDPLVLRRSLLARFNDLPASF